jgi:hypothetical protein
MGNAVIQRIALHPNAIERNVFRIAWRALKQQNPNGRQEEGSTHIDARLWKRALHRVIPGRRISAGPGIQMQLPILALDSGFARRARAPE